MLTLQTRRKGNDPSDGKLVHMASVVAGDDNLLREFFFRLPAWSLLRFKSVSKRWLLLITDPCFTRHYTLRNPPRISGIFLSKSYFLCKPEYEFISLDGTRSSAPFKSLTFFDDPFRIQILNSCNGLLCCSSYSALPFEMEYYVYNPTTKQYTVLPQPTQSDENLVLSLSLAFDPLESADYKVVCIRGTGVCSNKYQLLIYGSSAPYWRTSGDAFAARDDVYSSGVYWNGALHWVCRRGHPSLCFHVNREVFQKMPMAPIPAGQEGRLVDDYVNQEYVGASREHLYLVQRYDCSSQLHIFELESDYSGWNVKYRIDLVAVTLVYPEMLAYPGISPDDPDFHLDWNFYMFSVLHVQGEPGIPSLVLHVPNKIISYNLKEETFLELQDLSRMSPRRGLQYCWFEAYKYIETLSCV